MRWADGFDRLVFAQDAVKSNSYQQPLMLSLLLLCVRNCLACWRLAARERDLEPGAWPGMPLYIRRLHDATSCEEFLVTMATDVLVNAGKAPSRCGTNDVAHAAGVAVGEGGEGNANTPSEAAADEGAADVAVDDEEGAARNAATPPEDAVEEGAAGVAGQHADTDASIAALQAQLKSFRHSGARRKWLDGDQGARFRRYRSSRFPHQPHNIGRQKWCAYCTRTVSTPGADGKNKRRRVGQRTRMECDTCDTALCFPSKRNGMRDCFTAWHSPAEHQE